MRTQEEVNDMLAAWMKANEISHHELKEAFDKVYVPETPLIVVESFESTCGGCPSAWRGKTTLGETIMVRYRWGWLNVHLIDESGRETEVMSERAGDEYDGIMDVEELVRLTEGKVVWPS